MKIQIINGPNLNLLGKREPTVYGNKSFEDFFQELRGRFKDIDLHYYQSNVEGEIINKIHEVGFSFDDLPFDIRLIVMKINVFESSP